MSLFNDLMLLTEQSEAFFFKDFIHSDNYTYRIFNYRLTGWQEFQTLKGALECRGIMFRKDPNEQWSIVSRPMEKFFNSHEGGVEHDWNDPISIMVKEDGSLISTFVDQFNHICVKSKGSLSSSQALESQVIVDNSPEFAAELKQLANANFTVNMEYVSPFNRIVLPYSKCELRVLNVRSNFTGEYMEHYLIANDYPEVFSRMVGLVMSDNVEDFVASVPEMKGIEGFVIHKNNGEHVKLKTDEYIVLHHSKDSINTPKALYMVVLEDATDDLREMFVDDEQALSIINNMEHEVFARYNHAANVVTEYHENNSHLSRKDYAIKGQQELDSWLFSIAMRMYVDGNDAYLDDAIKKQWKVWGDEITKIVYGSGINNE